MRIRYVTLFFLVTVTLSIGAWAAAGPPQGPGQGPPPPPDVTYITVEPKTIPVSFDYVGVTEASKTVEVRARVQGFLETRDFVEGSYVTEGTTLFTIDPRSFAADLDIAAAQVEQAESRLKLAEQDVKRLKSVTVPGAIAATDLDQKLAEQTNAAASLRLAKAMQAKSQLELSYTTVAAPLNGFIGKAEKEIGSLVDANQNSLLAVMRQVDPIYVSFPVSELEFLNWRNEEKQGVYTLSEGKEPYLEVTLLDGSDLGRRGRLNFEATALKQETGTVEMRGEFSNSDLLLKTGQFVKVHVRGYVRANTIAVPQRAVSQSPRGAYVFVIGDDNKAELRMIKPGQWSGSDWIVEDGLKPGERVIVEGIIKVQPNIEVAPKPESDQQAAPEQQATPEPPAAAEQQAAPGEQPASGQQPAAKAE